MTKVRSRKRRHMGTLSRALGDIGYERDMLLFTVMLEVRNPTLSGCSANIVLESLLVHARNLREFLYGPLPPRSGPPKAPGDDDVISEDFFRKPARWAKARPQQTDRLLRMGKLANKHLAHITYDRVFRRPLDQNPVWQVGLIAYDLLIALEVFRANADRRVDWSLYDRAACSPPET